MTETETVDDKVEKQIAKKFLDELVHKMSSDDIILAESCGALESMFNRYCEEQQFRWDSEGNVVSEAEARAMIAATLTDPEKFAEIKDGLAAAGIEVDLVRMSGEGEDLKVDEQGEIGLRLRKAA
jgi:hypothetical protein